MVVNEYMSEPIKKLISWIRDSAASAHTLLVPVSGGSDSAFCFWLCSNAFPEKTIGVHAGRSLRRRDWFESCGNIEYIDIPGEYSEREEMRWARFLALSIHHRAWLVGSRNRTEDQLGTYSLSSRVAAFFPLIGLWKSKVMELCKEIDVPKEITVSSMRADPDCGRPEKLAEIPFPTIELFLKVRVGELPKESFISLTEEQRIYLDTIYTGNLFKKNLPIRGPFF